MQNQTIILRTDDVLVTSSQWPNAIGRFQQVHNWVRGVSQITHRCTFLIEDMRDRFAETIPYFRDEIQAGYIDPQLHGYSHIDYKKLSFEEIREHLKKSKDYMYEWFGMSPTVFATPWGANAQHIKDAAEAEELFLEDTSEALYLEGNNGLISALRRNVPLSNYYGRYILSHWWVAGARVGRLGAVAKYGDWASASKAEPALFK